MSELKRVISKLDDEGYTLTNSNAINEQWQIYSAGKLAIIEKLVGKIKFYDIGLSSSGVLYNLTSSSTFAEYLGGNTEEEEVLTPEEVEQFIKTAYDWVSSPGDYGYSQVGWPTVGTKPRIEQSNPNERYEVEKILYVQGFRKGQESTKYIGIYRKSITHYPTHTLVHIYFVNYRGKYLELYRLDLPLDSSHISTDAEFLKRSSFKEFISNK